jgi:hypothetical protein
MPGTNNLTSPVYYQNPARESDFDLKVRNPMGLTFGNRAERNLDIRKCKSKFMFICFRQLELCKADIEGHPTLKYFNS